VYWGILAQEGIILGKQAYEGKRAKGRAGGSEAVSALSAFTDPAGFLKDNNL
jgi:hypothetical protein